MGAEEAVEECGGGGFAVGACDSDKFQFARRVLVVVVGHDAEGFVAVVHHDVGHTFVRLSGHTLAHYGHGSLFDSLVDVVMAVHGGSFERHKAAPFPHLA